MAPSGGQQYPPESSSAWQFAASNSTVNTFLGGRQPSWMTNAKPVKPTPRLPPPSHVQLPQIRDQGEAQQPPTSIGPPRTAPGGPSPASEHYDSEALHLRHHQNSEPDPDQTAARFSCECPPPQLRRPAAGLPLPPVAPFLSSLATPNSLPFPSTALLPFPAPTDETSSSVPLIQTTSNLNNTEDLAPFTSSLSNLITNAEGVTTVHSAQASPMVSGHPNVFQTSAHVQRNESAYGQANAHPSRPRNNAVGLDPRVSSPASMMNTPPTPSLTRFAQNVVPAASSQQGGDSNPAAKRRRIEDTSTGLLQSLGAYRLLVRRINDQGGEEQLDPNVERPRYSLLKEACVGNDLFCVVLHQLFCAWSVKPRDIHGLCVDGIHDTSKVDNALGLIGTILKSNSKIRVDHLQWFTQFPASLDRLKTEQAFREIVSMVLDFLIRMSSHWVLVSHNHKKLRYPLLLDEMLGVLSLHSRVLQVVMFRASRRSLGVAEGPIGTQMDSLFREDQRVHGAANGKQAPRVPLDQLETDTWNRSLIQRYRSLLAQLPHGQARARASVLAPSGQQQQLSQYDQASPRLQSPYSTSAVNSPSQAPGGLVSPMVAQFGAQAMLHPQSPVHSPRRLHSDIHAQQPSYASPMGVRGPSSHPWDTSNTSQGSPKLSSHIFQWSQSTRSPSLLQTRSTQPVDSGLPSLSRNSPQRLGSTNQIPLTQTTSDTLASSQLRRAAIAPPTQAGSVDSQSVLRTYQHRVSAAQSMPHQTTCSPIAAQLQARWVINQEQQAQQQRILLQQQQRSASQLADRLVPPPGIRIPNQDHPHDPHERKSVTNSLHQADVRSPKRMPVLNAGSGPGTRWYQAIKAFLLPPQRVMPSHHLYTFQFFISESVMRKITKDQKIVTEAPIVNMFFDGSFRVRLRCCNRKISDPPFSESSWATSDTVWPDHMMARLNSHALTIRRKPQHSKDLPIELGAFLVPGQNILEVSVSPAKHPKRDIAPYITVEVVETLSHQTILSMIKGYRTDPPSKTREIIKQRLAGNPSNPDNHDDDDDDFAIVASDLSIDITDPFSATIFAIPVRGLNCTHLEVFDLETWLTTRPSKKSCTCGRGSSCTRCPREPSLADKWKCPLCFADARPYSLRIDGFLAEVRTQLERESKMNAKSILVAADGTWKAKEIVEDDDDYSDEDDEPGIPTLPTSVQPSARPSASRPNGAIELIELD